MLICVNLQTSFLTPPFGWALFFLRGVAPPEVTTGDMYRGVIPFVAMQVLAVVLVFTFPDRDLAARAIGWWSGATAPARRQCLCSLAPPCPAGASPPTASTVNSISILPAFSNVSDAFHALCPSGRLPFVRPIIIT